MVLWSPQGGPCRAFIGVPLPNWRRGQRHRRSFTALFALLRELDLPPRTRWGGGEWGAPAVRAECAVRHCGKFPNEPVAPLRAGRQCKPLWLLKMCSMSKCFPACLRMCSLIPGFGVKLSAIILAGPTVLSAVGACPPHDGVRRRWWINVASAVSLIESSQKIGRSHHRHRPGGDIFSRCAAGTL